ncbi:unnamed protein product [Cylindrotheca closterium]|uniref:Transmembrane protein n=1 Tax=Cylindrotheca closterium TaxID=2856 RepID=A0AAD2PUP6_9STRA|nr:unnamed protein product [Cylindrotheca closterium]
MVSADIDTAPSDEHLMEGWASKVETVVEDECDLPVRAEESRDPSSATGTQETGESSHLFSPEAESSDAPVTPSSSHGGSWLQRDGIETAKPSSGNFWFRKKAKSGQGSLAAGKDLDESARRNEEKGAAQQNKPWWKAGREVPQPIDGNKHLNGIHRQYRGDSSWVPQADPQGETGIVVRSEPVNVLWDLMSRAIRESALWRAATKVHDSSKAAAEERAKQGAAVRHGFRRFFRKRKTDDEENIEAEKKAPAPKVPWWSRFRRNRSNAEQPSVDGETSTAIVPYQPEPHPVAAAMKKAAAGVAGTCMVIVGVPLLLFPVPGPGVAMIASGVYVVSTEFEFARSWLENVKTRFGTVFDRLGIEVATPEALAAPKSSSPVLLLPPSLPPANVDGEIKDSNEEEESDDHKKEEGIDSNEVHSALEAADGDDSIEEYRKTEEMIIRA